MIYLGYLNNFKNSEMIHGGSQYEKEAPHIFILNFWKVSLGLKIKNWFEPILDSQFYLVAWQEIAFAKIYKNVFLELPEQIGDSRIIWFRQFEQLRWAWRFWDWICFLLMFSSLALFLFSNLNMYAMMQCMMQKWKNYSYFSGTKLGLLQIYPLTRISPQDS